MEARPGLARQVPLIPVQPQRAHISLTGSGVFPSSLSSGSSFGSVSSVSSGSSSSSSSSSSGTYNVVPPMVKRSPAMNIPRPSGITYTTSTPPTIPRIPTSPLIPGSMSPPKITIPTGPRVIIPTVPKPTSPRVIIPTSPRVIIPTVPKPTSPRVTIPTVPKPTSPRVIIPTVPKAETSPRIPKSPSLPKSLSLPNYPIVRLVPSLVDEKKGESRTIIVSNIDATISNEELIGMFGIYGHIDAFDRIDATTIRIRYLNRQSALESLAGYDGFLLDGRKINVRLDEEYAGRIILNFNGTIELNDGTKYTVVPSPMYIHFN